MLERQRSCQYKKLDQGDSTKDHALRYDTVFHAGFQSHYKCEYNYRGCAYPELPARDAISVFYGARAVAGCGTVQIGSGAHRGRCHEKQSDPGDCNNWAATPKGYALTVGEPPHN
jgi:hypothetical protein